LEVSAKLKSLYQGTQNTIQDNIIVDPDRYASFLLIY